ncbi:hypothetical protein [Streptomyces niveus]|uniref:hypothetical protein n=1 Tax=Streptomyces niveus TaxID=193462 RepID=UPI0036D3FE43
MHGTPWTERSDAYADAGDRRPRRSTVVAATALAGAGAALAAPGGEPGAWEPSRTEPVVATEPPAPSREFAAPDHGDAGAGRAHAARPAPISHQPYVALARALQLQHPDLVAPRAQHRPRYEQ